jgi:hypothetical protein
MIKKIRGSGAIPRFVVTIYNCHGVFMSPRYLLGYRTKNARPFRLYGREELGRACTQMSLLRKPADASTEVDPPVVTTELQE